MIGLTELLYARGLDKNATVKLIRHQDKRNDVQKFERGMVEIYQSYQSKPVFNCDFIVSFVGLENSCALLLGVYRVGDRSPAVEHPVPATFPISNFVQPDDFFYDLQADAGFEDLQGRVVIDWGLASLAWHQWLKDNDKKVVEVRPAGYLRPFPGYLEFILSFRELVEIVKNPIANREWHRMLSAVAGVYLIVDRLTGKQYIGSATGERGILSRWADYVANGHGGNEQLMELIGENLDYAQHFNFTVLQTLRSSLPLAEILKYESLYKEKLGSREFGYNSN